MLNNIKHLFLCMLTNCRYLGKCIFIGRGTQVNKQLQNCDRNKQEFKDDTQEGSQTGTS